MSTGARMMTCRQCGTMGEETPDDPAPGLCPACLDAAMFACQLQAQAHVEAGLRDGALLRRCARDLVQAGLTTTAAREFLAGALQAAQTQGSVS